MKPQISQINADDSYNSAALWFKEMATLVFLGVFLWSPSHAQACPGCYQLPYKSLLERVEQSDRAVIGYAEPGAAWKIERVLKGQVDTDERLTVDTRSSKARGRRILLWDALQNKWTVDRPADDDLLAFLNGAIKLPATTDRMSPAKQAATLRYFLPYLEHADAQIADSAHARLSKCTTTPRSPTGSISRLTCSLSTTRSKERIRQFSSVFAGRLTCNRRAFRQKLRSFLLPGLG